MPKEFKVQNTEEFEMMLKNKDFRISEALVSTILKNLKGKKRHHHALSIISLDEDAVYDVTIDRSDFCHTLTKNLNRYEEEEKYEECVKIREAIAYLKTKK
jgi:Ca2+-binding EF-hand superfamily protein